MQINILFFGRIALLIENRIYDGIVRIHQQDALGLAHFQFVEITLGRRCIAFCQQIGQGEEIPAELMRHFPLGRVGITQRLNIGCLNFRTLVCNGQRFPHLRSGFQLIQQKQCNHIDRAHHKQAKHPRVILTCGASCVVHLVEHKQRTQREQRQCRYPCARLSTFWRRRMETPNQHNKRHNAQPPQKEKSSVKRFIIHILRLRHARIKQQCPFGQRCNGKKAGIPCYYNKQSPIPSAAI